MPLIFVDCEAGPAPGAGDLREFGAVCFSSQEPWPEFYGKDASRETFDLFRDWVQEVCGWGEARPNRAAVFVSDNPAYDWQWINFYFWKYHGANPFGHSARRIGDFFAGLRGNFRATQEWKRWRKTPHDHNPVHDARGNAEAFQEICSRYGVSS